MQTCKFFTKVLMPNEFVECPHLGLQIHGLHSQERWWTNPKPHYLFLPRLTSLLLVTNTMPYHIETKILPIFSAQNNIGTTSQHKWTWNGYTHPHTENDIQQTLHWARFAAKKNPHTITVLITNDPNWYHKFNPHNGLFQICKSSHILKRTLSYTMIPQYH